MNETNTHLRLLFNFLTVYSSNMDFALVFPLILTLLSTGQSYTEVTKQTNNSCYANCPVGYYKVGDCDNSRHRCEKCKNGTYTEIENQSPKCQRCNSCSRNEVQIQACAFNRDVVCDCKEGFYSASNAKRHCVLCTFRKCENHDNSDDFKTKCHPCQSECLKDLECNTESTTTVPPSATTSPTIFITKRMTSTPTATSTGTIASNSSQNPYVDEVPSVNHMPWLFLLGVLLTFLVLFWLLLFITCCGRSTNKDLEQPVEDPKSNEQRSHQDNSSPTTLTFNISEETPMMTLSPVTPEHTNNISPLLPDIEHKDDRQDEQLEHWPAIILYAIIKEVPLRRWKEFLRLLSVADQQLDRVELEAGLGLSSIERQYQMLRLWSQRSSASLMDVFSALHYMDLSGCAQLLQESLETLQWRPEQKHILTV